MSISNMQKYENYRMQMGRLKKALTNGFYLEAIFIEYSIIEDRTSAILRYGGYKAKVRNKGQEPTLVSKLNKISEVARNKKAIEHKYFSSELIEDINSWKEIRNTLIHNLINQKITAEDLKDCAEKGEELCKQLNSKSSSYKKAIEKAKEKSSCQNS